MSKKIAIIGAGSGGLTSAIGLAKIGFEVTLIEANEIGGDCTHYGCVPSKTLIQESQKIYKFVKDFGEESKLSTSEILNLSKTTFEKVRSKVKDFSDHETKEWLESNGVNFVNGYAKFNSSNSIIVSGKNLDQSSHKFKSKIKTLPENIKELKLSFDYCVIATGSKPYYPPIKNILDVPILTNKTVFEIKKAPKSIAIIGAGAMGVELANSFANLGTKVSMLSNGDEILKSLDYEVSIRLKNYLEDRGVKFYSFSASKLQYSEKDKFKIFLQDNNEILAEEVLLAAGRSPNIDLDLEKAGVNYAKSGILIDESMRTSNSKIYALGDVASGLPKFTHFADYSGSELVKNFALKKYLKLPFDFFKINKDKNPSVIYCDYEIASFGLSEFDAKIKYGQKVKTYKLFSDDFDRLKISSSVHSIIKIVTTGFRRRVVGVQILNPRAGEMLSEFQNLIENKKSIINISKIIRPYPSYTFGYKNIVKKMLSEFLKPGK